MKTTTVFKNGGSQAVRIPKEMRFDEDEVYIKQVEEGILLMPKRKRAQQIWADWMANLEKYDEEIIIDRGGAPQQRDGLDEVFP